MVTAALKGQNIGGVQRRESNSSAPSAGCIAMYVLLNRFKLDHTRLGICAPPSRLGDALCTIHA